MLRRPWVWILIGVSAGVGFFAFGRYEALQTRRSLFAELQPVRLSNCVLERFGEANDGGYLVCGNLLDKVQSGYSYGISGYDGWGCEISERLKINMHEYDCFNTTEPQCPAGKLIFHPECIGATRTEEGRRFETLGNQIAANSDTGKNLIVKMDVEGAEWETFLTADDATLERIDQLVVEFHLFHERRFVAAVRRLREHFYPVNLHFNNVACLPGFEPFPAMAYEVLFVNKRLAIVDPLDRRPPALSPLEARNNPNLPDCQALFP